jgi:hypothetical protein
VAVASPRGIATQKTAPTMEDLQKSSTLGGLIEGNIKAFNGSIIRNNGKTLIGILKRYFSGVLGKVTRSDIKVICHFAFTVHRWYATMGGTGTVLKLKACQVLLMQAVAGYRIRDSGDLKMRVRRSRQGLPIVIPRLHR